MYHLTDFLKGRCCLILQILFRWTDDSRAYMGCSSSKAPEPEAVGCDFTAADPPAFPVFTRGASRSQLSPRASPFIRSHSLVANLQINFMTIKL